MLRRCAYIYWYQVRASGLVGDENNHIQLPERTYITHWINNLYTRNAADSYSNIACRTNQLFVIRHEHKVLEAKRYAIHPDISARWLGIRSCVNDQCVFPYLMPSGCCTWSSTAAAESQDHTRHRDTAVTSFTCSLKKCRRSPATAQRPCTLID